MSSRRFLQSVTILVCILIVELIVFRSIGFRDFSQSDSVLFFLFLPLVIISFPIQFVLLRYSNNISHFQDKRMFINSVNIAQFVIMSLVGATMLKTAPNLDLPFISILELNHILSSIVSISYALAIFFLVMISY